MLFFLTAVVLSSSFFPKNSFAQGKSLYFHPYAREFVLTGSISLSYNRLWGDDRDVRENFRHNYDLGLSGFVVDRRLMSFNVGTHFSQSIRDFSDTTNFYGFSTVFNFLNSPVRRGFLRHLPQPIQLRFSYDHGEDIETYRYGISITYRRPENISFFSDGKIISLIKPLPPRLRKLREANLNRNRNNLNNNTNNLNNNTNNLNNNTNNLNNNNINNNNFNNNQNYNANRNNIARLLQRPRGFEVTFPTVYIDYDVSRSTFDQGTSKAHALSVRAESYSEHGEYFAEYLYHKNKDEDLENKLHQLFLDANYEWEISPRHERFRSLNHFALSKPNETKSMSFITNNNWSKKLRPNLIDFVNVNLTGSLSDTDSSSAYGINLSSSYYKYFSERLQNILSASVSYSKNDNDSFHSEVLSNSLTYDLSRIFLLTNSVSIGNNSDGSSYGFGVGLSTKTRIRVGTSYAFSRSDTSSGQRTTNRFILDLSGRIARNMNFTSRHEYNIIDFDPDNKLIDEAFKERNLSLRGDLFWRLARFRVSLGATYLKTKRENTAKTDFGLTAIRSTISTVLRRNLYFTFAASYTKIRDGDKVLTLYPSLSWRVRRVVFTGTYEYTRTSGDRDATDHRLYLQLTRHFKQFLKPFF